MLTPLGAACEVREVQVSSGRRWHVKVTDAAGQDRAFYLWAERSLPPYVSEVGLWRGVLGAVDDELTQTRAQGEVDYELEVLPRHFESP